MFLFLVGNDAPRRDVRRRLQIDSPNSVSVNLHAVQPGAMSLTSGALRADPEGQTDSICMSRWPTLLTDRRVLKARDVAPVEADAHERAELEGATLVVRASGDGAVGLTLPAPAMELLALLDQPAACVTDIAPVILHDPRLAADVKRRTDALLHRRGIRVYGIRDALRHLTTREIREVVAVALAGRIFVVPGRPDQSLRLGLRSAAVAILCAFVADAGGVSPVPGWTAGVLHDVGWLAGYAFLSTIKGRGFSTKPDSVLQHDAVVRRAHPQLAARLLASHGVARAVCDAIASHHDLDRTRLVGASTNHLCVAGRVADHLGIFPDGGEADSVGGEDEAAEHIVGIGRLAWPTLRLHGLVPERTPEMRRTRGPAPNPVV